uniref:Intraflagellar transport protein 80 homolog n=1 Tax=Chlamydomonas leiostraca TaxID=1034604 RepID=A0A7S0WTZ1_9CHLO|mmetsp:Transcript_28776/g.73300  ORF Transcript_28776/g.73300 Transcript_28776/m.73300 type:complete len:766 (+) Transcript_28776:172-2469(+)|eukprot:CAMPEP_0202860186 /NCGR_PEP_ID=MMETSP1391-20130828/2001_1 /ASSEMBLY_ACC=CAM_ASM_000867 /TAXON_ID=1034604 /ORGANISM="Chlamydomonas leiostraca, Strain SAG 11-49" /LENGTH=765 /DNA_ID=CAMNT_0049539325 /DNA_START=172 /DNA_END=2469 /DNA_ORIENTATION=-
MRLKIKQAPTAVHTDLAGACGWSVWNELYSCGDDQIIHKWNLQGEPEGKVCQLDAYFTDMHWYPLSSKKNQAGGTDVLAASCTNGSFKILSRTGRLEKSVDAHAGACIALRWSYDGTALATAGEDGTVKIWSRNGMLRSTLSQSDSPVYSVVWAADSDQLCYSTGSNIVIKSIQSSAKQNAWKAHEGVVLKVDWSAINNMIVSGGEDCKYKVWDSYGRLLYQSSPFDYAVTSVAWSPNGDQFAVGSFDTLQLCDRMGWAYSKSHTKAGSLLSISWTSDGTQLAASGGNGSVVFGQVVDVAHEDGRVRVNQEDDHKVVVQDMLSETVDELEFRDKVIKLSLGYDHLIVATSTQCHIYSTSNWNTPHIFDLKDTVTLVLQAERHFLIMDNSTGIQLFTYEGRQICNPKFQGLRPELLNRQMLALSNDTIAVLDAGQATNGSTVRFFDTAQGRPIGEPFTHSLEIKDISLSQVGPNTERQLIYIDRNRDLYIVPVMKRVPAKLASMVDSALWHDSTGMLAAMVDCKLTVWYYPNEVYVDKELLAKARYVKADSEYGKAALISLFSGSKVLVRRSDGVLVTVATSPYPLMLYDMVRRGQWDKATRLCRFIKDPSMWATLAAQAMAAKELNTAEVAFAAIDEVDKLHFVLKVKQVPSEEGRNAELALYRRRPDEAEAILVQAGLVYRAIKMNIKLFRWDRALDLAQQYKQHVETVLWYRQRYLLAAGGEESNGRFAELAEQMQVDENQIRGLIQEEKAKEAARPGAKRYA